mmetsp:Transcript_104679/g.181921  ORF Transcript_104679/g.181921 Transcript_104679/m.181921 type:complete len:200 (+) Transcript_104679:159-758(+)
MWCSSHTFCGHGQLVVSSSSSEKRKLGISQRAGHSWSTSPSTTGRTSTAASRNSRTACQPHCMDRRGVSPRCLREGGGPKRGTELRDAVLRTKRRGSVQSQIASLIFLASAAASATASVSLRKAARRAAASLGGGPRSSAGAVTVSTISARSASPRCFPASACWLPASSWFGELAAAGLPKRSSLARRRAEVRSVMCRW